MLIAERCLALALSFTLALAPGGAGTAPPISPAEPPPGLVGENTNPGEEAPEAIAIEPPATPLPVGEPPQPDGPPAPSEAAAFNPRNPRIPRVYPEAQQLVSRFANSLTQPPDPAEWSPLIETGAFGYEDAAGYSARLAAFSYASAGKLFTEEKGGGNTLYSPVSLYMALAMLAECTEGETRAELVSALGMAGPPELGVYSDWLFRRLYADMSPAAVFMSNSLWFLPGPVKPSDALLRALESGYHAHTFEANFADPADGQRYVDYIDKATRGMLEGDAPLSGTLCVLLNTLYFEEFWLDPFDAADTRADVFTRADGSTVSADFMASERGPGIYAEGEGFRRTALSFNDGFDMHFILPEGGLTPEALLAAPDFYTRVFRGGAQGYDTLAQVYLELPKFDFKAEYDLTAHARGLGVSRVFDAEAAEFAPLVGEAGELAVSMIRQKTAVEVDELGCKAAAYTEVVMTGGSMDTSKMRDADVILDRPFIFVITGVHGVPLFVGIVSDPSGGV